MKPENCHAKCRSPEADGEEDFKPPKPPNVSADFPPKFQQAWNLATSLAAFVSDGCKLVSKEEYEERLNVCHVCEHRLDTRCRLCGCKLALKARGRAFKCPDNRWREL